ncbi:hypothetical protein BD408DRAFT_417258 [Parasitella parasitica]|nr:hypothetical protein BD408DRAFT_417258 [Parasitella parasitica]
MIEKSCDYFDRMSPKDIFIDQKLFRYADHAVFVLQLRIFSDKKKKKNILEDGLWQKFSPAFEHISFLAQALPIEQRALKVMLKVA